ncbi:unnamed protein product [Choristocarpus tenellus]
MSAVLKRVAKISVGDPLREEMSDTCMGPLVSGTQRDKVLGFISRAVAGGARAVCGGGPPRDDDGPSSGRLAGKGYYVAPTVLEGVGEEDEAWVEEIFGPVLCVRRFEEEEEAVKAANKSDYGLAAAVMSADRQRCERVARALRAGVVWQNNSQPAPIQGPWGGFGKSGVGRELGRWGLEEFLAVKQIIACPGTFSMKCYPEDSA